MIRSSFSLHGVSSEDIREQRVPVVVIQRAYAAPEATRHRVGIVAPARRAPHQTVVVVGRKSSTHWGRRVPLAAGGLAPCDAVRRLGPLAGGGRTLVNDASRVAVCHELRQDGGVAEQTRVERLLSLERLILAAVFDERLTVVQAEMKLHQGTMLLTQRPQGGAVDLK